MDAHETRTQVSRAYTQAVERTRAGVGGGCCGPMKPADADPREAARITSELAGYGTERERFEDAAASSFGCGNPLAFVGVEPGQTVVDLGSGAGFDLLIAAEKVGPEGQVIGIDMTDAMIETARANVAAAGFSNVEIRRGLIEELPIADGSADWVISNCVINLSPEKPRVFAEIARVLRPGGRFSISDIVTEELPEWLRGSVAAYAACVAGAVPEAEYLSGLRAAGLEDVQVVERLVYRRDQLRAMAATEIEALALPADVVEEALAAVDSHVASIKVTGRRAGAARA